MPSLIELANGQQCLSWPIGKGQQFGAERLTHGSRSLKLVVDCPVTPYVFLGASNDDPKTALPLMGDRTAPEAQPCVNSSEAPRSTAMTLAPASTKRFLRCSALTLACHTNPKRKRGRRRVSSLALRVSVSSQTLRQSVKKPFGASTARSYQHKSPISQSPVSLAYAASAPERRQHRPPTSIASRTQVHRHRSFGIPAH